MFQFEVGTRVTARLPTRLVVKYVPENNDKGKKIPSTVKDTYLDSTFTGQGTIQQVKVWSDGTLEYGVEFDTLDDVRWVRPSDILES